MHFVCAGFTIRMSFSIAELEYAVIKAEELQKRPGARQMVMPWLRCPNPRTREGEAGATKAKEDKGPVADTVQEAGMDGTAAEDGCGKRDGCDRYHSQNFIPPSPYFAQYLYYGYQHFQPSPSPQQHQ